MNLRIAFAGVLLAFGPAVPALAQETTEPAPAAPVDMAPAPSKTVPKLAIAWDCGECVHNDKVIPLIEAAYAAEAAKNGAAVSETETAEAAITDIRQRPPGVRVMFGIMSGKDRLGLRIRHAGKEYAVSETSANAVMGLNHLSESVGKKAYAELSPKSAE